MSNLVFLFRNSQETEEEFEILQKLYPDIVHESRMSIPPNSLVVGRFSVLPFYKELENDLLLKNAKLINTYSQHLYVADLQNWYQDLKDYTPKTWFTLAEYIADKYEGPVVLKGATNSRRELWKTHMFANNKDEARQVYFRLMDDSLIKTQNVYIRKYEPLVEYCKDVVGMPIVKEFRFFVFNQKIIAGGFYWSNYIEEAGNPMAEAEVPTGWLSDVIDKVGDQNNFYSIDVAQKLNGEWMVVELNDGCMSGVNSIHPKNLYERIFEVSMGQ